MMAWLITCGVAADPGSASFHRLAMLAWYYGMNMYSDTARGNALILHAEMLLLAGIVGVLTREVSAVQYLMC
jgi:hypothetical protein